MRLSVLFQRSGPKLTVPDPVPSAPRLSLIVLSLVASLLAACSAPAYLAPTRVERFAASLPDDAEALIQRADETYLKTRRAKALAEAAIALERALESEPARFEAAWRAARIYVALAERMRESQSKARLAKTARGHAEMAVESEPTRPEGHYYLAAANGLIAAATLTPNQQAQAAIEGPLETAVEIDEGFDSGGPLRILGTLYVQAPPWPAGVGDLDTGLELLERAVQEHPSHPLNHFFLAKAYAKIGRFRDARRVARRVLTFPRKGEWALVGGRYRVAIRQLLRDISR